MLLKNCLSQPRPQSKTVDPGEIARFTALAEEWWNPNGKFRPIHRFNPVRRDYIFDRITRHFSQDREPDALLAGLRILDRDATRPFPDHLCAIVSLVLALFFCIAPGVSAAEKAALWRALASEGHVALLRHAIAPGTGDPPEFTVGDCSTQRNLSTEGRAQAANIGARFRANGLETAHVFSSQWCRCLDTAKLFGLGLVEELPILNSFYQRAERRNQQTKALKEWLAGQEFDGQLVLVTHQVNIIALTDVYPASGELVVIRISEHGEIAVIGSIETD